LAPLRFPRRRFWRCCRLTRRGRGAERTTAEAGPPRPTLVIQTAFLGDVVLTIPLLQRLADRRGPVDVVTTPAAASLLETHPAVRRVLEYDKKGRDRGWRPFWSLVRELRAQGYARVYLAHPSWRSACLALLARIPERIGFAESPAALTYTSRIARPGDGHEVRRLEALAGSRHHCEFVFPSRRRPRTSEMDSGGPYGLVPGESGIAQHTFWLALTDQDHRAASDWLTERGLGGPFVALAPGSVWDTKRWPYYPELAGRLSLPVVVVGGRGDAALALEIVDRAPGRAFSSADALSLRQSAALIERAAVLVTNDSLPLHLASAVGTPIVAIFGPTVPAFGFGPIAKDDVIVEHQGLTCRPCSRHGPMTCPLGHHRCMRELAVEQVLDAVETLLGEQSRALPRRN
jgi:heptosyltransferase II